MIKDGYVPEVQLDENTEDYAETSAGLIDNFTFMYNLEMYAIHVSNIRTSKT
jgi:hypothetical protein